MRWHLHDWGLWSEPKEHVYYVAPNPVYNTDAIPDFRGLIQERTCSKCGKYQWRKL